MFYLPSYLTYTYIKSRNHQSPVQLSSQETVFSDASRYQEEVIEWFSVLPGEIQSNRVFHMEKE